MDLSQSIIYFPDTKTTVGKNGKEIRAYDNIVSKGGAIKAVKEINHKDFQITGGSQKEARQKQTIYGFTVNSRGITANSEKKMDIGSNKIVEIDSNGLEQDQLSNAHHWSTF